MKRQTLLLFFAVISVNCFSQTTFKKNDLYLEAGGAGLFTSINYERQLTKEPGLGIRLGVGFYTEDAFYLTIPVGINYLFSLSNHTSFIDAGLNVSFTRADGKLFSNNTPSGNEHFVNFVPSIGFRKHTSKNIMWRASISPVANKFAFTPWLGLSVGKRF